MRLGHLVPLSLSAGGRAVLAFLDDQGHAAASPSVAAPVSRHTELTGMVPALVRGTREVSARLHEAAALA